MHPVPDRKEFITTVLTSLKIIFDNLQYKNTDFAQGVRSCHATLMQYIRSQPAESTLNDIVDCLSKLDKLNYMGSGITGDYVKEMNDLKRYMKDYELSQKVQTNSRKAIPDVYRKQDEADFVQDTIDFLANLYNKSDQRTQISKSIRECVEIFWEYNVTWKRIQRDATLDDIHNLLTKMVEIRTEMGFEHSPIGSNFASLKRYLTEWFRFNKKPASTPDIPTRVQELEKEVQELRRQIQELLFHHPAPLQRQALLKQLARCT